MVRQGTTEQMCETRTLTDQPRDGKIKAARCAAVGRLERGQ